MQVKFIGQGLCEGNDDLVGNELAASIANPNFSNLEFYVAFLSTNAAEFIVNKISSSKIFKAKLYIGVDLQGTSKEALELLLGLQRIQAFIFYTTSSPIYHPKVYVFKGDKETRVIIGSSNLTSSGLFSNIEASTCIDFSKGDVDGINFLKQLDLFFKPIVNKKANVQILSQNTIDVLHAIGIVPTEAQQRANRKGKLQLNVTSITSKELATLFPTRKTTPSPLTKIKSKQLIKPTMVTPTENNHVATIAPKNNQKKAKEFWIQTGSLTGGSKNQLDLSIISIHNQIQHGSLSLFGVNSANTKSTTMITIRYKGLDYFDNHIKYPQTSVGKTNGTWRLQLRGKSKSGDKLTPHCRTDFINIVLVFKELATNHYEITAHPSSQLSVFKNRSVLWDQNRPKSTGRHYGEL